MNINNNINGNTKSTSGWPLQLPFPVPADFMLPVATAAAVADSAAAEIAAQDAAPIAAIPPDLQTLPSLTMAAPPTPRGGKLPVPGASEPAASLASTDAWLALMANLLPPAPAVPEAAAPPVAAEATAAPAGAAAAPIFSENPPMAAAGLGVAAAEAPMVAWSLPLVPDTAAAHAADNDADFQHFAAWMQKADALAATAPAVAGTATAPSTALSIPVPVNHSGWGEALGHHVTWSLGQGVQQVRIQLHPEELGPISVQLRLDQDQAQISFTAAHAQTREAIEQALPRLRELLRQEGINLGQASVQSQASQQDGHGGSSPRAVAPAFAAEAEAGETIPLPVPPKMRRGLVDDYV